MVMRLKPCKHTVPLDDGKWLRLMIASAPLKVQLQPDDATVARIREQVFEQIAQDSVYLVA